MHILFAGGGTAGHINPALAVAGYIREKHPDAHISYIGTSDKLEAKLVPEKGYNFRTISVAGFKRSFTLKNIGRNISAVRKMFTSSVEAKKILKELQPDVVLGTGGYVSGPVLREAAKLGFKTAIHEQNAFPGITNKMLAELVDTVMLAMPEAQRHIKCKTNPVITGNPIRRELLSLSRDDARRVLGIDSRPLILSFGGSLGARPVNEAVEGLIKWHNGSGKFHHIHATGSAGYKTMLSRLEGAGITLAKEIDIREYISDMDVCMTAADLIICRAGAITISELEACGKPSVLIPSPYVAENHQYHNAMTLKRVGAAEVIEERYLTSESLIKATESLIENKDRLLKMSRAAKKIAITDANERIYDVIIKLYTNA